MPIGNAVEPSPGGHEAKSAAERRLHAVVDTLGLHVYSGETYPDDRFVTLVALTPSRSLLGFDTEGNGGGTTKWLAAIHPDDRARYDEVFCYANECLLHPLELEYRLCGDDGVERWVWERIFPHRLRPDGVVDIDGVVADVTALHERNELARRLERVLGGVAEFVVTCELRDGRTIWTDAGPGAERMLGGPLPEGADGPTVWYECVHPDDRAGARRLPRAARTARAGRGDVPPARARRRGALGLGEGAAPSVRVRHRLRRRDHRRHGARARAHRVATRPRGGPSGAPALIRRPASSTGITCSTSHAASWRARSARAPARHSCCSTSIAYATSTRCVVTQSEMPCCANWPAGFRTACALTTRSRTSVAVALRCSCPICNTGRRCAASAPKSPPR